MLAGDAHCTGTTHPLCGGCARRHWPEATDRGRYWLERCNQIAPPIIVSTGHCPEFREKTGRYQ